MHYDYDQINETHLCDLRHTFPKHFHITTSFLTLSHTGEKGGVASFALIGILGNLC